MVHTSGRLQADFFFVVDAPPRLLVRDSAVLSTICDGVILVVSAGKTLDTHGERALEEVEVFRSVVSAAQPLSPRSPA